MLVCEELPLGGQRATLVVRRTKLSDRIVGIKIALDNFAGRRFCIGALGLQQTLQIPDYPRVTVVLTQIVQTIQGELSSKFEPAADLFSNLVRRSLLETSTGEVMVCR